ncbi:hypothetical protein YC2023_091287 [Brassica napus]
MLIHYERCLVGSLLTKICMEFGVLVLGAFFYSTLLLSYIYPVNMGQISQQPKSILTRGEFLLDSTKISLGVKPVLRGQLVILSPNLLQEHELNNREP